MAENPSLPEVSGQSPEREFHPVAGLFPLLRGAAFEELAADIRKNGLREPILLDAQGRILDGRNRYRACLQAGVEPRFVRWQGEGPLAELALSLNLRRRHLDESQRAMVAARLAKLLAAKRKDAAASRVANLQPGKRLKSLNQAAGLVNVSSRLVSHAAKVMKDGCEELIQAVESGGLAVSTASMLARLPRDEQAQALAGGARHAARKAREIRAGKSAACGAGPSPGRFGVFRVQVSEDNEDSGMNGVVFLWVAAGGLAEAIEALKARGFEYTVARLDSRLPGR